MQNHLISSINCPKITPKNLCTQSEFKETVGCNQCDQIRQFLGLWATF